MKSLPHRIIRFPDLRTDLPADYESFGGPDLYKDLWRYAQEEWDETARIFEANPGSFYNAWRYLNSHPIYWQLKSCRENFPLLHMINLVTDAGFITGGIWMDVVRVNPDTRRIEEDPALNTMMRVWLETGEFAWEEQPKYHINVGQHYHNYKLDCGGASYEEAVIKMAHRVWKFYGNDRRRCEPGYSQRKAEKRDQARKKQSDDRRFIKVAESRAYGHSCRHAFPSGTSGQVMKALAELKQEG